MWTIAFECERCDAPIRLPASERGKTAHCRDCGEVLTVPLAVPDMVEPDQTRVGEWPGVLIDPLDRPFTRNQLALLVVSAGCLIAIAFGGYGLLHSRTTRLAEGWEATSSAAVINADDASQADLDQTLAELEQKVDDLSAELAQVRGALAAQAGDEDDQSIKLTNLESDPQVFQGEGVPLTSPTF